MQVSILILIQMKMRSLSDPIMQWSHVTAFHSLKLHVIAYLSPGQTITAWQFYHSFLLYRHSDSFSPNDFKYI